MKNCGFGGSGRGWAGRGWDESPRAAHMRAMRRGPRDGFGFEGGWAGPGGGHRGRRGGGRLFGHGALRWLLLSLIAEKPSHGYELIKAVEARLGGAYSPSPGVIYPTLTLLEEMGALTAEAQGGKKRYAITDDGRRLLDENAEALAEVEAVTARFSGGRMRPEPIETAVRRLRAALKARMTAETPPTEADIAAIAQAVNAAADAIEAG